MLTTDQVNELHRLHWSEHCPFAKSSGNSTGAGGRSRKYLDDPAQGAAHRDRPSKLDPFKGAITEWLEKDPRVTAAVIEQKLRSMGYQGGHSIVREHVRNVRPQTPKRVFVRMEPLAGQRFEVDWGHRRSQLLRRFAQALCLRVSRCAQPHAVCGIHSQPELRNVRPLSHSRVHVLGGVAREVAYDNLATAVAERDGRLAHRIPRILHGSDTTLVWSGYSLRSR